MLIHCSGFSAEGSRVVGEGFGFQGLGLSIEGLGSRVGLGVSGLGV